MNESRNPWDEVLRLQMSTLLFMIAAIFFMARYALFLFSGVAMGDTVAYLLLCVGEGIGMMQYLGIWITAPFCSYPRTDADVHGYEQELGMLQRGERSPEIAVLIPVYGEPIEIIRQTVLAARDMSLPHRTIILDDGRDDGVRELAHSCNVEYLTREEHTHGKAGNVNAGLERIPCEFFAIFDSDHVPRQEFLLRTLPYLLARPKLAFVQTPQHYRNTDEFISGGVADMQAIFYRYVQAGKNAWNAAFCVGTNVLFRREAVDDIGGIYEQSNSEDIWTTLLLHERGWQSLFVPLVLAQGLAPRTIGAHFRQQYRWAKGGLEILFKKNPLICKLTTDQKIQYLHTTMHYLGGIAVLIFYVLPLLYAYFQWRPISTDSFQQWLSYFLPYFGMLILSLIQLEGKLPSWRAIVIGFSAFPMHIVALVSVLTGTDARWKATGVEEGVTDYIVAISPHLILLFLGIGGIPLALLDGDPFLRFIVVFWLVFNCLTILSLCKQALPKRAQAPERTLLLTPENA